MKKIHGNKLAAVLGMKWRTLFSKNFIAMPIFAIGLTFGLKLFYGSLRGDEGGGIPDVLRALALGLGAVMNVTMTGILCTGMALAEEKEKHTLRALMTSSVNGLEFFLGSTLPVVIMMAAVNVILIPVAGMSLDLAGWAVWLGISLLCSMASAVLGMILGICAKNQMTASTLSSVPLMVLMMIPVFGSMNETMGKISSFLYTGILQEAVNSMVEGAPKVNPAGLAVILAEVVLAGAAFLCVYRRNGYDRE